MEDSSVLTLRFTIEGKGGCEPNYGTTLEKPNLKMDFRIMNRNVKVNVNGIGGRVVNMRRLWQYISI